ncbi:MAG: hypothetical protein BWX81_00375 [Spirochaetes bacterium ADurb.Bin110]|nr:MAG: hypothetical protein BWX81_00375 [Spirochaetes bacterium ADurb.Bin110]
MRNAGSSCGVGFRELGELDKAERCAHFVDAVVEAWLEHIVGGCTAFHTVEARHGHAMRAQVLALLVELWIARHDHATFSHREVLVGEETPGRYIAEGTELAALVGATIRMRRILDELEIMPLADIDNRIHITGIARIVHNHHRLRARRDLGLDIGRVHCPIGQRRDIPKHHLATRNLYGVQICNERERRHNHLIPRPYPTRQHRNMQRRRAIGHCKTLRPLAQLLCVRRFKIHRPLPHRDPARLERLQHCSIFSLIIIELKQLHFPLN